MCHSHIFRSRKGIIKTAICLMLAVSLLAIVLMATGGAAVDDGWTLSGNPIDGRDLFISKGCVVCHTVWGKGGTLGPDLSQIGRNKTLMQLSGLMWNHSKSMDETIAEFGMARPILTVEEMQELLSYLFFLNYFDEPGDFFEGERVFHEKKCVECHSVGGEGGTSAPPLDSFRKGMSPLQLAQAMWNTGGVMSDALERKGITMPDLHADDMSHLLAYIRGAAEGELVEPEYLIPGDPNNGELLFSEMGCVGCHSDGGSIGPDLRSDGEWKSVSEWAALMWNHSSKMWSQMEKVTGSKVRFEGNELADIIAYLYYTNYADEPGDPLNGRWQFEIKNCSKCHQVGGIGVATGVDIAKSDSIGSAVDLATSMWNHAPIMVEMFAGERFTWPKFYGNEMRDLVSFIREEAAAEE